MSEYERYEDEDEVDYSNVMIPIDVDNFEELFDDVISQRGEEYYRAGSVNEVIKEDDDYNATVDGTYIYDVRILIENNKLMSATCSCPYYTLNHDLCKHIYAVLKCIKNGEYKERYIKPCACPKCKSKSNVVPVIYGKLTKTIKSRVKKDELLYGGEHKDIKKYGSYIFYKKWYCKKCKNYIYNNEKFKIPISYEYLNKIVDIVIDRTLGSKHPKHDFIYPINYGYVPNTINGDDEELDCYVLGEFEPLKTFTGRCIAIIHRLDEDDDKLVIVKDGKNYSKDQIEALTEFQERFFKSEMIL